MDVLLLQKDGRCKWLENKVLKIMYSKIIKNARDPFAKKMYIIIDWMSNDNGKVGVDLKWLKGLGIPVVRSYKDLPKGNDYLVVNTGYDSIVHEEKILKDRGVQIVDVPCPFIRKIRKIFENVDKNFQYVLLCEPNHIIIKNYASIFPEDLILVQMNNYEQEIIKRENGKPLKLVPYVTFLESHANKVFDFINKTFPNRGNEKVTTHCMWIKSKSSPIVEINELDKHKLEKITTALLIASPGSVNKSLVSLIEAIENKGLMVVKISSLTEFINYEKMNKKNKILLVRSPIPNKAEKPILIYLKYGYLAALLISVTDNYFCKVFFFGLYNKMLYFINLLFGNMKLAFFKKDKRLN
jgi:4-hydroxy-3-methylbut-2-enyl diphosphate reductase IspH